VVKKDNLKTDKKQTGLKKKKREKFVGSDTHHSDVRLEAGGRRNSRLRGFVQQSWGVGCPERLVFKKSENDWGVAMSRRSRKAEGKRAPERGKVGRGGRDRGVEGHGWWWPTRSGEGRERKKEWCSVGDQR